MVRACPRVVLAWSDRGPRVPARGLGMVRYYQVNDGNGPLVVRSWTSRGQIVVLAWSDRGLGVVLS